MCVCVLVQDSRFIKVPHFSDVPVDVHLSVQEKLTPVTDALSRVSKLVCEDLERAVQLSAGQDKEGEERSRSDAKRTQTWLSEIPSFRLISCYLVIPMSQGTGILLISQPVNKEHVFARCWSDAKWVLITGFWQI